MSNEDPYRTLGVSSSVVSSLNDNNDVGDFIDTDDFELNELMNSFINNPMQPTSNNSQFSQSYLDGTTFGSFDQPTQSQQLVSNNNNNTNNNYSNNSHNNHLQQQHSLFSTSTASQQQSALVGGNNTQFDSQHLNNNNSTTTSLLDEGSANFNHHQQQQHSDSNDFYYKEIDQALSDYDSTLGLQVSNVQQRTQQNLGINVAAANNNHMVSHMTQQQHNVMNNSTTTSNNNINTAVANNNNNGVISFGPLGHQVIGNLQTNFVVKQENIINNNGSGLVMLPIQGFDQQQQQQNNAHNNGFNTMMVNQGNYQTTQPQLVGFNNAVNNSASNNQASVEMLMMMQSMNQLSLQQQQLQQNLMINTSQLNPQQQHNMANNNMISTPTSGNNSPTTFINPFQTMSVGTPQSPSMVNNQFPVKKVENNLIRMAGRQKRSNSTSSVMSIDSTQSGGSVALQKHIHVRSSSNNSNLMGGGNVMFNNNNGGGSCSGNNSPNTNNTMVNFPTNNNNQIMFNGSNNATNNQMMNNNAIIMQQQQFNRVNGAGNMYSMSEPSSPVMGMMISSPSMSNSSSPNTAYGSPTTSYISNAMSSASSTRSNSRSRSGSANVLIGKQMAATNKRTNSLQFHTYSCDDEGNVKQNATVVSPNIAKITNVENRKKRSQSDGNIQVAFEKQARKKSSPIASMSPQTNDTMQQMQQMQPMQTMQPMEQSSGNFTFIDATNTGELSLQQQQALFSKKNYMPQYVLRHNIYDEFKFKSKNPNQKYYKFFANQ